MKGFVVNIEEPPEYAVCDHAVKIGSRWWNSDGIEDQQTYELIVIATYKGYALLAPVWDEEPCSLQNAEVHIRWYSDGLFKTEEEAIRHQAKSDIEYLQKELAKAKKAWKDGKAIPPE